MTVNAYPRHVAIIMDGNGRWAAKRHQPRVMGHRQGLKALLRLVEHASETPLEALTIYAFSRENWGRPAKEVSFLHDLMVQAIHDDLKRIHALGVRVCVVGDWQDLHAPLKEALALAQEQTAANTGLILTVAFNYSGRWHMTQAVRAIGERLLSGALLLEDVKESTLDPLMGVGPCDPDLLIRTSGELRLSNFLLWPLAYTELYFTSRYWPDFTPEDFDDAVTDFLGRERRFGCVPKQMGA